MTLHPLPQAPALQTYTTSDGVGSTDRDRRAVALQIPCQEACPAATDVPLYLSHIARGDWDSAYAVNLACNVFPGVLGRICTRPCQSRCRHLWTNTNGPVTICHLKRSAADRAETAQPPPPWFGPSGKRVAVVGGGPAGLAAARDLRRLGHDVTLFERAPHLGGMLVDGIPRFRLPLAVVTREIDLILATGVAVRLNESVDAPRLRELSARFDAVLVATGNTVETRLTIPGVPPQAALSGLDFMRRYNAGELRHLTGDVAVIGGGFTAVDCARAAARAARKLLGATGSVSLLYRRAEQHMAAHPEELEELARENIHVRTLVTAVSGTTQDGRLTALTFRRNVLAAAASPDAKPAIEPVPDSDFTVPCTTLIVAIGQSRDDALLPPEPPPNLFTAGDFAGSTNVIEAVASGKRAARALDEHLTGARRLDDAVSVQTLDNDGETGRVRDHDLLTPRPMPVLPLAARATGDAEVEAGLDDAQTAANARRCYLCHYSFEIDTDACIQCGWCLDAAPRRCIRRLARVTLDADGAVAAAQPATAPQDTTYIWIDPDACIRCGKCLRVCPTGAIRMRRAARVTLPCAACPAPTA